MTSTFPSSSRGGNKNEAYELKSNVKVDESVAQNVANAEPNLVELDNEAKQATAAEHSMSLLQAIKTYPKAIAWSMLLSFAITQEGYDTSLVSAFNAYPAFTKKYGVLKPGAKTYQIPAPWQAGLSNGARVGEIMGLFINGIICDRIGFKKTMIGSLFLLNCLIFITFFAPNIQTLLVAEILLGIPWGVFQTLTTAYASEVAPTALRPYLTTYVNLNWGLGQLIAQGVLRGNLFRTDQWAYRIPFALQWIFPIPLIIGISLAPESPWWLVRKGRIQEAKHSLMRLSSGQDHTELDNTLALMQQTNNIEKELCEGTSYLDCFRGTNLRRTEITCIAWVIQAATGANLISQAAYFFEQGGLPTSISFDFAISLQAIAMIGVVVSWFTMTRFGRRTIYLGGLLGMITVLFTIGCVSFAPKKGGSFATGTLLLLFTLIYDITTGSVAYSIVAEMPSSRLRTKTIVLARNLYNCQGTFNGVITPYMLNPSYWNWKGKVGFFWAGTGLLCLIWTFFRLPEPKGRTYAELDLLFERGVSARNFSKTVVDPFASSDTDSTEVNLKEKV